ncbi:MAG: DoxX family membrane protein [Chloroflexi bacterium]|nr:MAG: DoxX family membrane protein [Chloroflexota bacterium]
MKSSCLVRLSGNAQQPLPALGAAVGKKGVQPVPRQESPSYDRWPGYATLPLRYFLGATFVYAGLQKIADRSRPSAAAGQPNATPSTSPTTVASPTEPGSGR